MRRLSKPASAIFLKGLWLIPILTLGYIGWMNLLPSGGICTHLIDVGGEDTGGLARITGPFDRISSKITAQGTNFRELEQDLVYFELEDSRLWDADEVEVRVRFNDNFPGDAKFILGAEREEGSYYWKDIYVPFYGQLADLTPVAEDGNIKVYATEEGSSASFGSVDEFQQNPPLDSVIARNDEGLSINQRVSPEECGGIDVGELATGDAFPIPLAGDVSENGYLEADTSLRGMHTFYFFATGDTLQLRIAKRDLNAYEGTDVLNVQIYSLDGILKAAETIPDDGDATRSKKLGDLQYWALTVDNLERGTYRLVLTPLSVGDDFVITYLRLDQAKLVVQGSVFLAGNLYLDEEPQPMVVWYYNFVEAEIQFRTLHDSALQIVTLSGERHDQTINIDAVGTRFSTGLLKPGIYQITSEKGDVIIEAGKGYFAFTEDSLFLPTSSSNREENGNLVINTALRGGHTIWTYVTNGSLDLEVTKQDLNWYEGPDELKIEVYSFDGELEGSVIILDDGDEGNSHELGLLQSESLRIQDVERGAYKIELESGGDLLIRGVEISHEKLVVEKRVYLVGMNAGYFESGLPFDPVILYGKNSRGTELKFFTWHNGGLQQMAIGGDGFCTEVDVNKVATEFNTSLKPGPYQLIAPGQDIIIEYDGYLSFTPDSFFLPKRCEVLDLKYDLSWVRENADYIIIDYEDYVAPVEDDGWLVAQASWNVEDLFIKDNELSFCFSVPHLTQTEGQDKTIPIDWIEISLKILPIWERM